MPFKHREFLGTLASHLAGALGQQYQQEDFAKALQAKMQNELIKEQQKSAAEQALEVFKQQSETGRERAKFPLEAAKAGVQFNPATNTYEKLPTEMTPMETFRSGYITAHNIDPFGLHPQKDAFRDTFELKFGIPFDKFYKERIAPAKAAMNAIMQKLVTFPGIDRKALTAEALRNEDQYQKSIEPLRKFGLDYLVDETILPQDFLLEISGVSQQAKQLYGQLQNQQVGISPQYQLSPEMQAEQSQQQPQVQPDTTKHDLSKYDVDTLLKIYQASKIKGSKK